MTDEQLIETIAKHLDRARIYVNDFSQEDKIYRGFGEISVMGKRVKDVSVSIYLPKEYEVVIADELNRKEQRSKSEQILNNILTQIEEDSNKDLNIQKAYPDLSYPDHKIGTKKDYKIAINLYEDYLSVSTELYPPETYDKEDTVDFDTHLYIFLRVISELPLHFLPSEEEIKKLLIENAGQLTSSSLIGYTYSVPVLETSINSNDQTDNTPGEEVPPQQENPQKQIAKAFKKAACQIYFPENIKESFDDFIGYENLKEQIKSAVIVKIKKAELLKKLQEKTRRNPELAKVPYSLLFEGPPGVGKTMVAKIIAKETNMIMVYVSADQILSKWVGETEQNIRKIFTTVKKFPQSKFLLFFDEIDTIGSARSDESKSWERSHLLTLMQWLEGIESSPNYVFVATTNRKNDLDKALLSRFKEIVAFNLPSQKDIMEILKYYAKHLTEKDYEILAKMLVGKSPREIKNICEVVEQRQVMLLKDDTIELPSVELYKKVILEKINQ